MIFKSCLEGNEAVSLTDNWEKNISGREKAGTIMEAEAA